jgi:UDPglucose--hexose-1-phosphate uridylyltransferase
VHLYPNRRVLDFTALDDAQRATFPGIYLGLLRRFDRLFPSDPPMPTPYIAAWHQAPTGTPGEFGEFGELTSRLELFTVRRTPDKLKYLAGTESGMGAFMNDVSPDHAAQRLREVAS